MTSQVTDRQRGRSGGMTASSLPNSAGSDAISFTRAPSGLPLQPEVHHERRLNVVLTRALLVCPRTCCFGPPPHSRHPHPAWACRTPEYAPCGPRRTQRCTCRGAFGTASSPGEADGANRCSWAAPPEDLQRKGSRGSLQGPQGARARVYGWSTPLGWILPGPGQKLPGPDPLRVFLLARGRSGVLARGRI